VPQVWIWWRLTKHTACLSGVMISDRHIGSSEKFASSYQRLSFDAIIVDWFIYLMVLTAKENPVV